MKLIHITAKTGERIALPVENIAAICDDDGFATITVRFPFVSPIPTDWLYDTLVAELVRIVSTP